MMTNRVQFQPGLAMVEFMDRHGSDGQCETALIESRWPSGFARPACWCCHSSPSRREGRLYSQCTACRHHCSVSSGTIFEATKLGLSRWFLAMHLLTQSKNDVAARSIAPSATVVSDGLWCFGAVQIVGAEHERVVTGGGKASTKLPQFKAINTFLGNLKRSLSGTCHAFDFAKYAHRYLAEAQYRFIRRFGLRSIVPRLLRAACLSTPAPAHVIRVAEVGCQSSGYLFRDPTRVALL